ncbi:MAG: sulfotransferase domain-containing protein [Caulobacteraceae bacterium]
MDSRRWDGYAPRAGDVVIATHPKCGTTWTQRIVGLLIFQSPEPLAVMEVSPWVDSRFTTPIDAIMARIEGQTHRRFLKSHLPLDALPVLDEVRYIHVARDGLDACMSWHNHTLHYKRFELLDKAGLDDETIGRPYPRPAADPGDFFRGWIDGAGAARAMEPDASAFFSLERSYWTERRRANLLMVHYNDLTADLDGEMRRIAAFLGIETPAPLWPNLVEAATFEAMKGDVGALLPGLENAFEGGAAGFLFKGSNERWRESLSGADAALYRRRAGAELSPGLDRWLRSGRLAAGDPATMDD